jgi:hypothetical protein
MEMEGGRESCVARHAYTMAAAAGAFRACMCMIGGEKQKRPYISFVCMVYWLQNESKKCLQNSIYGAKNVCCV